MLPEEQRSRPAIRRRSVVFPQPDAPTTVMNSPGITRTVVLSSARTRSPEAVAKIFETAASSMTGAASFCFDGLDIERL
jgi:hypothetical protein